MSDRAVSRLWPRPAAGLPPGQRLMRDSFPRFGNRPQVPPPPPRAVELRIDGLGVAEPFVVTRADLDRLPQREQVSDFHCVTTWTVRGLQWTGVPMRDFWHEVVVPRLDPAVDFAMVEARGGDGYKSVKHLTGLRLRGERPPGRLEHLRGRVALEERHGRVPGWLLRWPYRALIVPTATRAERSLRAPSRG